MDIFRPIRRTDFDAFVQMAQSASIGITNMPKNPDLLLKKIEESLKAFGEERAAPVQECYLFVLENLATGQVGGISGLFAKTGMHAPEFFFGIEMATLARFHPAVPLEMPLLRPLVLQNSPSEICSLFLSRTIRKAGLGRLLSLSRFLFIASFPKRFDETVTALMRGYFDAEDRSPFWEGVGRKFLDVDFLALLRLREGGEEFVRDILPQYPLYVRLLSQEAQSAIGRVHANTLPALQMLKQEGFSDMRQVDFFDAGPRLAARCSSIRTIRESCVATVGSIVTHFEGEPQFLICNGKLDFRAVVSPVIQQGNQVALSDRVAHALEVKEGDQVRYVTAR
jgi:arginine N-succinyltransferase